MLLGEKAKPGVKEHFVQQGPLRGLQTLLREASGPPRASEEAR